MRSFGTERHLRLAKLLASKRRAAGLTQVELAKRLSRPQSFVTDVERGKRRVDLIEFVNVADAVGFDPILALGELLTDGDNR